MPQDASRCLKHTGSSIWICSMWSICFHMFDNYMSSPWNSTPIPGCQSPMLGPPTGWEKTGFFTSLVGSSTRSESTYCLTLSLYSPLINPVYDKFYGLEEPSKTHGKPWKTMDNTVKNTVKTHEKSMANHLRAHIRTTLGARRLWLLDRWPRTIGGIQWLPQCTQSIGICIAMVGISWDFRGWMD